MTSGMWVLLVAVVASIAFGLWRAARDGRFRGTRQVAGADLPGSLAQAALVVDAGLIGEGVLDAGVLGTELGERATLLQFSSAFCAPCRATRVVLADVAQQTPGVKHVEIDAEQHLDVVRRLGVVRTPTTLILDANGAELTRAVGAPRRDSVVESLKAHGIT